jgi:hypothetical protein
MTTTINASSSGLVETSDTSGVLQLQTNGNAALTIGTDQNATFNSTGAITVPVGNTAQRPSSPANGMIRYNSSTNGLEGYILGSWTAIKSGTYTASYLIVAGGGGGGSRGTRGGGGGGAGGLLSGTTALTPNVVYSFTVGGGGAVGYGGSNGTDSTGFGLTATGGGGGGYSGTANSGGSGGGGRRNWRGRRSWN